MNISNYIQDLLYRYECVVLPGFGAFLAQKQSAFIDESSNEFFPPKKVISFNRQLIKNDGLLANYIAEVENVKYQTANNMIQEYVYDLESSLQNASKARLENIGELYLDNGDKLQFEPVTNVNFLTQSFGLDTYKALPVNREVYKKQVSELEEKAPITFTPESKRSSIWKYAAIGLIALGISSFAGLNIYSSQVTKHNIAEQQEAENQLQEQIQQATFVIDNPLPAVTFEVEKQSGNYHVVAGAFRVEENAQTKVDELKAEGFKARLLGANKYGLHQVVYSSHQTRREAINKLYAVKKTNDAAWLLVQEL
ncbi:SPOR domain-containing protein [uncultured Christiangramia sp.]|uniref:HU domain-containing protein n=1 Tax=uncultured Christiangramia sp. TaxID=503836 RepID=UPI0025E09C76|nr:SPOR domain-containing protein [uncultured Christiangramia sp.]|tara:strand:- start:3 stop:932 length:930 start_codon:yes stop_codon:yes gene_type:complete